MTVSSKIATEEFVQLSNDRDKVEKQYHELEQSLNAINDLIAKLDKRKNETIMFTFKQVSYHFSTIFSQLLPAANAHLVLKRNSESKPTGISDEDISSFTEVGIKVTFNKEDQNFVEIGQLSGGQKTLVTLALIFAFQKCDPVPFYLFDEVDQALDPYHRQTFSKMLGELSIKRQFIVTTFRPEILSHNPTCFRAEFKHRISTITPITVSTALSLVDIDSQMGPV
ncbi:hypothetical protein HZS_5325 [Henneguya salminicola]|nr:hypothetical protein HZS_5325 [Henneguya salminicola]